MSKTGQLTCNACGGLRLVVPSHKPTCVPYFRCMECRRRGNRKCRASSTQCEIDDSLSACEHCDRPMTLDSPYRTCQVRKAIKLGSTPKVGPAVSELGILLML